jgi:hypothetical protein
MSATTRPTFFSTAAIRAHATSSDTGNAKKWFGASRFFSTRLLRGCFASWDGWTYFATSDARGPRASYGRGYSVRRYNPTTNDVETVGEFNGHGSPRAARKAAQEAAAAAPAPK